jgi:hypothetical protein
MKFDETGNKTSIRRVNPHEELNLALYFNYVGLETSESRCDPYTVRYLLA